MPIKGKKETKGIFMGGEIRKGMSKPEYTIYGYIKPEGKRWVAVCVNMCLVAQGKTPTEAFEKMVKSASSYIYVLKKKFPRKWKSKLECESPDDFVNEFSEILKQLGPLFDSVPKKQPKKRATHSIIMPTLKTTITPGNIFVQPISANYIQASG